MRAWMLLLVVGMAGCGEKRSPEEEAAIAEIKDLGGAVEYDEESPDGPRVRVDLYGLPVTDAGLEHLNPPGMFNAAGRR